MFIYELTDEKGNVVAFSDEGNDVFYREDIFYPDYAITADSSFPGEAFRIIA